MAYKARGHQSWWEYPQGSQEARRLPSASTLMRQGHLSLRRGACSGAACTKAGTCSKAASAVPVLSSSVHTSVYPCVSITWTWYTFRVSLC